MASIRGCTAFIAFELRAGLEMDPDHSREISEVYRQHGINPLAGCIPALAPFTVLVAFYSVLTGIAELRGAH